MLAERLLGKCDYDCDRELRTLELLKVSGMCALQVPRMICPCGLGQGVDGLHWVVWQKRIKSQNHGLDMVLCLFVFTICLTATELAT